MRYRMEHGVSKESLFTPTLTLSLSPKGEGILRCPHQRGR